MVASRSKRLRTLDGTGRADLEAMYRNLGNDLWRSVYAYCGGVGEIADDAVSEAFAQAGTRLGEIRNLRPWLFRAAFRIAAGELQRRRRWSEGFDLAPSALAPDEGRTHDLLDLLRTLSPNQRGALVLRDLYGYPSKETGRILGISEVAVRVHLHAAHRRLRGLLEEVERT
jgi:RNA polymerase sigma-70 factor (ECF subfamily)